MAFTKVDSLENVVTFTSGSVGLVNLQGFSRLLANLYKFNS